MQQLSRPVLVVCVATFVLVWAWIAGLELRAPAVLFAALQSAAVLGVGLALRKASGGTIVGLILSALLGWLISFLVSIFLEWTFSPYFHSSISQHVRFGSIHSQMYGWFVASVMYLGILQGPLVFCSLRIRKGRGLG
ncbi:hypothetical protein [Xanthomonas sp. WHRI 8932A]|uniref:hypothetical protein n=1 Tax=unclassified Xanthomonas TaxID=2643310 RepID=UPI002B2229DC|nr:hypothetical protein [Xanthomonas sp. WHRI 8932A]MEA9565339.1 hypothetical protein [Xanthomonas sp. WHRI 8932A]